MAKLTMAVASRVAGVARSTLYRAIQTGRLSADPDGRVDTAELLRAGYTLHLDAQQAEDVALHDATQRNTRTQQRLSSVNTPSSDITQHERDMTLQRSARQNQDRALHSATQRNKRAQQPSTQADTPYFHALQHERDLLRLERDLLRQQLEAAQMREQAAVEREREAREERQAAREREALLLRMVEQTGQRYDRLLDAPRSPPLPRSERSPHPSPGPVEPDRGAMRRRIVALLRDHPKGLTTAELRTMLGVGKRLAHTCLGMQRDGLLRRLERGRYVVAEPAPHQSHWHREE